MSPRQIASEVVLSSNGLSRSPIRMENDHDCGDGMTTHTFPALGLEPITCQPWCEASDGHPNQRLREDQCCVGPEHRVPLSSEPNELFGEASTQQQYLNTYLMRLADDKACRVFIGYNEAPGRPATLDEARQFTLEILALVDGLQA